MNEKFAVYKIRPAVRPNGVTFHYHGDSKRPCFCRAGTDATFQQAMSSAPKPEKAK